MSIKNDVKRIREMMNVGKDKTIIRIGEKYANDTMSEADLQKEYQFFQDPVILVGEEFSGI